MLTAGFALLGVAQPALGETCNSKEVGYIASFKVTPGNEAAFEAGISNLAAEVNAREPGVVLYAPYKGVDGEYWMMERYQDLAAREVHASAPEVQAAFGPVEPLLAEPPIVRPVSAVCP
jgi:quinol monooxygenase YgiN